MSDNIRIIKFETIIDKVQNAFSYINFTTEGEKKMANDAVIMALNLVNSGVIKGCSGKSINIINSSLGLIYDYNELNDYGKVIVKHSSPNNFYVLLWSEKHKDINCFIDFKYKLNVAREFVKLCKEKGNTDEGYKFIFWAMFILAVDKKDAEEKLSLICDFAYMLNISNDELMYIFMVLKSIIYKKNYEQKFIEEGNLGKVSDNVCKTFSEVLKLCEN